MRVKALTNIKYGADWHRAGEVFEIQDGELEAMKGIAERAGEPAAPKAPETEAPAEEKPKRTNTRRRKE